MHQYEACQHEQPDYCSCASMYTWQKFQLVKTPERDHAHTPKHEGCRKVKRQAKERHNEDKTVGRVKCPFQDQQWKY